YARPEDFAALEQMGVDVKDKIVLARYGEIFRGLKVRNAQKRGARGILIYSDPGDDGYARGDIYPQGPYRSGSAVQRARVHFLPICRWDHSTPSAPSVTAATRLPPHGSPGFPPPFPTPTPGEEAPARGIVLANEPTIKDWEAATGLVREDYFATIPSLPIA